MVKAEGRDRKGRQGEEGRSRWQEEKRGGLQQMGMGNKRV